MDKIPWWVTLLVSAVLAGLIGWQTTGTWVGAVVAALSSFLGVGALGARALPGTGSKVP